MMRQSRDVLETLLNKYADEGYKVLIHAIFTTVELFMLQK